MEAGLSRAERSALEALDLDGLVALLRELIAIPSLDGAESPAQRRVAAWMRDAGLETDEWPIDLEELSRHPDWCHEVDRDEALGVVGWHGEPAAGRAAGGSGAGRDLLLNGHIDVVPVGDEAAWTTPPWDPAVRDGRVYGRGAVDMKGGLVCALFAAEGHPRCRRRAARAPERRQRRRRGGRRHGHAGDDPPRALGRWRRRRRADEASRGPGAGRLADVPAHGARPVGARLRARGGRERRREVRAAVLRAAPARGGALRGEGRDRAMRPSPAIRTRRSSPATACRGRSRSAR